MNRFINAFNWEPFFLFVNLSVNCTTFVNRFFDWFMKLVHWHEPFLCLWTFSKLVHVLCPFALLVTKRFVNRFLWTLLFMVSFFPKGSHLLSFFLDFFFTVLLHKSPKFMNRFWTDLWTELERLAAHASSNTHWADGLHLVHCGKFLETNGN